MYIDVHINQNDPKRGEHGVKIHIDEHFQVRSNDVLNFKTKTFAKIKKRPIPGIPAPELKVAESKFSEETISWNYFQIDSHPHNISLRIENIREIDEKEIFHEMVSPLESIHTKMRYNSKLLSNEYLDITNCWISLLIKWVELAAEIDERVILPILRYIDKNHSMQPGIHDELSISILVDDTSMIKITDEITKVDTIFKEDKSSTYSGLYPIMGLNEEALKYISFVLNHKKFIVIKDFIINLRKAGGNNADEYVDTFIQIFFDLMARDAFDYQVSYFS